MALTQLVAVVVLDEFTRQPAPRGERVAWVTAGLLCAAVLGWRWRRPRPLSRDVIRGVRGLSAGPTGCRVLSDGVSVSVDRQQFGTHVTIQVDGASPEAASLLCVAAFGRVPDVVTEGGTAHLLVAPPDAVTPDRAHHA